MCRFFITTAFKIVLIIFNKSLLMHNLLYKAFFSAWALAIFKEITVRYAPYENPQINNLQVICVNIQVTIFTP